MWLIIDCNSIGLLFPSFNCKASYTDYSKRYILI